MLSRNISLTRFVIFAAFIDIVLYHFPLFKYAASNINLSNSSSFLIYTSILIALYTITAFLFFLVAFISKKLFKIFLILTFIGNSIAVYFILTYGVIIDKSMMSNVFNTNYAETSAYFNTKIFLYIFVLGIIPSIIVSKIKLLDVKKIKLLIYSILTLIIGVFLLYLNSSTWLWIDKHSKYLGGLTMPWAYSINAIRFKAEEYKKNKTQILLPDGTFNDDKKTVVVLVIGESARADHFSLYGYSKHTNPNLEKLDLKVLKNTYSTTTYTTASVNSMLSHNGSTSDDYEPLTNYLHRMGAYVEWRTDNWGEPKQFIDKYIKAGDLKKKWNQEGYDFDGVLLAGLEETILNANKNKIFIVLHTAGSHGPTYFKKYPKEFEIFKPVCKSVDLKECTKEELINAYDNTIVYTDYFLSKAIKLLDKLKLPTLFMYISDHGESLGEYNLYLHGTPYAIAPDCQKKVPFLIWQSKEFIEQRNWKEKYIKENKQYGQNHVFHTIINAFNVKTPIYNKSYDLLNKK